MCVCVCVPPRSRCTVGNEGIRSREQINLSEDNEIISHLQLLDEGRKQCRCVCMCVSAYLSQALTHVNGVTLKTICTAYWGCAPEASLTCVSAAALNLGMPQTYNTYSRFSTS